MKKQLELAVDTAKEIKCPFRVPKGKIIFKPNEVAKKTIGGILKPDQVIAKEKERTSGAPVKVIFAHEGNEFGIKIGDYVVLSLHTQFEIKAWLDGSKWGTCYEADVIFIVNDTKEIEDFFRKTIELVNQGVDEFKGKATVSISPDN